MLSKLTFQILILLGFAFATVDTLEAQDEKEHREWYLNKIETCALGYTNSHPIIQQMVIDELIKFIDNHLRGCGRDNTGQFPIGGGDQLSQIKWLLNNIKACIETWLKTNPWIDDIEKFNSHLKQLDYVLGCSQLDTGKGSVVDKTWRKLPNGEKIPNIPYPPNGGLAPRSPKPIVPNGGGATAAIYPIKCHEGRLKYEIRDDGGWKEVYDSRDSRGNCKK